MACLKERILELLWSKKKSDITGPIPKEAVISRRPWILGIHDPNLEEEENSRRSAENLLEFAQNN